VSDLSRFAECLFDPTDTVEVRRLPAATSTWHLAGGLAKMAKAFATESEFGQSHYVGANPRTSSGNGIAAAKCSADKRCGKCAACVALARSLFVDIDRCTLTEARHRLAETDLPAATVIVESGGGVHAYWRLLEPLEDLARWSRIQKGLIAALGSDPAVHDLPRIMRAPGFLNRKYDPPRPRRIVEADPERTYGLIEFEAFEASGERQHPANFAESPDGPIAEGSRNSTLTSVAGSLRRSGCDAATIAAALTAVNAARCSPPLPDREVAAIARSVGRYAPGGDVSSDWVRYPTELLPEPIRDLAESAGEAIGCDPSMIAHPALGVLAGCVGASRWAVVKTDWAEPAVLWPGTVSESGTLKSPAQKVVTGPLQRIQTEYFQEHDAAMARYELEARAFDSDKRKDKDEGERPAPPTCKRCLASDITLESLGPILADNPAGVPIIRDGLGGWLSSFNQ